MSSARDDRTLTGSRGTEATPDHDHVAVAVTDTISPGVEHVPARHLEGSAWQLLRSPLYARHVAGGDTIELVSPETGEFRVLARGGNVCIHFYLSETAADDASATGSVAESLAVSLGRLGGRVEASTPGLISASVPVTAGFPAIEQLLERVVGENPGAQWEYTNVYDQYSGEPLRWWE